MGYSIMDDVVWKRVAILSDTDSGYAWGLLVSPEVYREYIVSNGLYIIGVNSIPYNGNVIKGEVIEVAYAMCGGTYVYVLDDYIHGKYSSTEYDHVIVSVGQLIALMHPAISEESKGVTGGA